ncbi:polyprenyl synthetase family protein [Microbacterium sp. 1.5R]|uniref:polyprenyl synthetase family protein n=1 Tax=Microbacterium sp. 1.5R TaxID=1916917 RepID=UPI0011A41ED8|nr:polyprenyl synthetase family protein [Microbacterium sp. 1.5R]
MAPSAVHEDMGTRIEEALRQRFVHHSTSAETYGAEFAALWRAAADHSLGGKLVRPRLLLDIHRALTHDHSASLTPAAVEIAALIELLHYAFLLHDDVIDGDLTRRKGPNLIGALAANAPAATDEGALHWARSSAILMGDLLLTAAVMGFARADVPADVRGRLLDLVEETIIETVAGEHTDVALSHGIIRPDLSTVLDMSIYKTATYSFSLPLRAAALLSDSSPAAERTLTSVGRHLGLAYQLQDDLLCVFGDHRAHGKDAFSDLREGKETAIIAYARSTETWAQIAPLFGSADLSQRDAETLRELLRVCGAETFVSDLIGDQLDAVHALLTEAELAGEIGEDAAHTVLAMVSRLQGRRA